jgi:N-terminal domain of anti-restriction factor ArdC
MRSNLDRRAPLRAWWPRVAGQVEKTPPAPHAKEAPERTGMHKTPEQRAAKRTALLDALGNKVAALASSSEWMAYLRFVAALRRYSFNNLMLIAAQCPNATRVAGYRTWQQFGRQVRKGENAIKIIGHSTKKITTRDPETGEDIEDRIQRWPILSVFDVSQTEGDDVPSDRYELPDGDGPDGALPRLIDWLEGEGWELREQPLPEQIEGYTDHKQRLISTTTGLEPAARLAVLLHEAAHAVLHEDVDAFEYRAHRGICETEAESVAYVLAALLGLDLDASSVSYIAGWSHADPAVLSQTATNVLRAVNAIAAGLGFDDDAEADAELGVT